MIPRLTACLLLACPAFAGAQPDTPPAYISIAESSEPSSRGRFRPGELVVRRVTLVNPTNQTIALRVVGTNCPCTTARLAHATLSPAAETTLTLSLSAAQVSAPQTYNAEVQAVPINAGPGATPQRIVTSISYSPRSPVAVFPRVASIVAVAGDDVRVPFTALSLDGSTGNFLVALHKGDWASLASQRPHESAPNTTSLEVAAPSDAPGLFDGMLVFDREGEREPVGYAEVSLRILPPLRAAPAGFVLRESESGWSPSRAVITLSPESARCPSPAAASIHPPIEGIAAASPVKSGDGWTITLTADPSQLPAHGSTTVQVLSADQRTLCTIPVVWFSHEALSQRSAALSTR
jgi:hypothetical protein